MRDKYVEIIKEYIREKPEYRAALDELKACVLTIGATEEEFDEAIRQSPDLQETSKIMSMYENQETGRKRGFVELLKYVKLNKKYAFATVFIVALTAILTQLFILNNNTETPAIAQVSPSPNKSIVKIPIVYANSAPINPEEIFSIRSAKNIQLTVSGKPKKEVLGFFPYWMLPEQDKIDLSTITSISLFGIEMDGNGNIVTTNKDPDGWSMWKDPSLDTLIRRAKNQGLNVYLTLKCFNNSNIESISKSDVAQKNLIANALYLVNSKELDGINIDFEYVGSVSDVVRDGFTRLIVNFNSELKRQIPDAILTVDTYLTSGSEKQLFNLPILAKSVDAFVIMGYDMHTPSGVPGAISAMGGDTNIIGYVQNYLEQVGSSKLILAIPYYGYDWPKDTEVLSADNVKILPYAVIAEQSKNLQLSWDDTAQTPYFTYTDGGQSRIVYFDNVRSLGIKYDFINSKNLKGVGIWTLGYDGQNQDLEKLLIDKFINQ